MIVITQNNQKWRISLKDEVWEFETKKDFNKSLNDIIDMKEAFGNLPNKSIKWEDSY